MRKEAEREKEKVGEGGREVVNTISHSLFKKVLLWSND